MYFRTDPDRIEAMKTQNINIKDESLPALSKPQKINSFLFNSPRVPQCLIFLWSISPMTVFMRPHTPGMKLRTGK